MLITLRRGCRLAPANLTQGQFVANGQRPDANYFMVDGVSANVAAPIRLITLPTGPANFPLRPRAGAQQHGVDRRVAGVPHFDFQFRARVRPHSGGAVA